MEIKREKSEDRSQGSGVKRGKHEAGWSFFWTLISGFCLLSLPQMLFAANSAPVAEVNRVPITSDSVEKEVRSYLRQIGHKELSPARMMSLRKEVLDRLIDEELVYQEALKQGGDVSSQEIDAEVDRIRKRFPAERDFDAALVREGLTLDEVKQGVRRFILVRKTWSTISPSDETGKRAWLEGVRKKSEIKIY